MLSEYLALEAVQTISCPFGQCSRVNRFPPIQSRCPLNHCFFHCMPWWASLYSSHSVIPLPTAGHYILGGVPHHPLSLSILHISLLPCIICCTETVQSAFSSAWRVIALYMQVYTWCVHRRRYVQSCLTPPSWISQIVSNVQR